MICIFLLTSEYFFRYIEITMSDKEIFDYLHAQYGKANEVAKALGVSLRTFQYWKSAGELPLCWKRYLELKMMLERLK